MTSANSASVQATPVSISTSTSTQTPVQLFYDTSWGDLRPGEPSALCSSDGQYILDDWGVYGYMEDADTTTTRERRVATNKRENAKIQIQETATPDRHLIPATVPPNLQTVAQKQYQISISNKISNRNNSKNKKPGKGKEPAQPIPETVPEKQARNTRLLDRNRIAANKYRTRKQSQKQLLESEEHEIEDYNRFLHKCLADLTTEAYLLKMQLLQHTECKCVLIQSFILSSDAQEFAVALPGMTYENTHMIHTQEWLADAPGNIGNPSTIIYAACEMGLY